MKGQIAKRSRVLDSRVSLKLVNLILEHLCGLKLNSNLTLCQLIGKGRMAGWSKIVRILDKVKINLLVSGLVFQQLKVKGEMTLKSKVPDVRVAQSSELVETIVQGNQILLRQKTYSMKNFGCQSNSSSISSDGQDGHF